ncbi:MAG: hypothetical protein PCFJNLEI_02691 [Verrucomicrobiae bacterium]|nr:hypothetical protein [Verrucomicrobiae bacterium]
MDAPTPDRQRANAKDVLRDYGVGAIFLLIWEIWCIRDGWFHEGYEHITFSRAMAWISGPILIFCLVMATSAALTLRKLKQQPPPPATPES